MTIERNEDYVSGAELVTAERLRQVEAEGWTADHDAEHDDGELAAAAFCYEVNWRLPKSRPPKLWPWDVEWWKPSEDEVRNLVKAGALYQAEIDRLTHRRDAVVARIDALTRIKP